MHKLFLIVTLASLLLAAAACEREQAEEQSRTASNAQTTQRQGDAATEQRHAIRGRVTAIDQKAGEITIDHDPVESLNWPAMIMPFPVRNPAMLADVEVGDRVTFTVIENDQGEFVIEEMRKDDAP